MVCTGRATMVKYSRLERRTTWPDGASERVGNALYKKMLRRRGEYSKKLRNRVTDSSLLGTLRRSNVLRFDIFSQGRLVITPFKRNSCSDERSPLKMAAWRTSFSVPVTVSVSVLRSGAGEQRCSVSSNKSFEGPDKERHPSQLRCGTTRRNALSRNAPCLRRMFRGDILERSR